MGNLILGRTLKQIAFEKMKEKGSNILRIKKAGGIWDLRGEVNGSVDTNPVSLDCLSRHGDLTVPAALARDVPVGSYAVERSTATMPNGARALVVNLASVKGKKS